MPSCPKCNTPVPNDHQYCARCGMKMTKRWPLWSYVVFGLTGLWVFVWFLGVISTSSENVGTKSPVLQATSPPASRNAATKPAPSQVDRTALDRKLKALQTKFVISKDEFSGITTARHKVFSKYINGNGTTLVAEIHGSTLFVESQYVADDWIFHETVTIKAGDVQLLATGREQRDVVYGGVVEVINLDSGDSLAFAELIANSSNPVRVRLAGKYRKDYTLRAAHQQAISETVQLWRLSTQNHP